MAYRGKMLYVIDLIDAYVQVGAGVEATKDTSPDNPCRTVSVDPVAWA